MRVFPAFAAILAAAGIVAASPVTAETTARLTVMASIKPVHSLVAGVMKGVGEPGLIVDGAGSPHAYSLRPSQARDLERADLVFWIGPGLEAFLVEPLDALAADARTVPLMQARGLDTLALRAGGAFEDHDHADDDSHGDGDDHAAESGVDAHIWLDPVNAKAMVGAIADALTAEDPAHAARYAENAAAMKGRIDILTREMRATLAPVKDRPYVVFHDAYRYLERRLGLAAAGSITASPEIIPGARRIAEMQHKIRELGAACVFAEPQFEPRIVSVVIEGTDARSAVLDPLGADIEAGANLYFTLMRRMADSLRGCLSAAG